MLGNCSVMHNWWVLKRGLDAWNELVSYLIRVFTKVGMDFDIIGRK
jgi:hypothetical protein